MGSVQGWGSEQLALVMGDFGLSAAAGAAAVSCFFHARTHRDRLRAAWILFAVSSAMLSLGNFVCGWYEVVLERPVPMYAYADAFFLGFAPPAVVGLLVLAKRPASKGGWVCLVVDAWLIAGSLLTAAWSWALTQPAQSSRVDLLSMVYPLLDIALVSMVLVLHFRRAYWNRPAVNTALGALALTVMCDALFTSPLMRNNFHSGRLLDAGWFAGSLLLAYAPWAGPLHQKAADERESRPFTGLLAALTPYLAAAVCTLGILYNVLNGRSVDRMMLLTGGAVVLALMVRQGVMLLDNITLTQELVQKENHFRSLVQGSSDVIMIAAPSGILRYVSPAAAGVYGWPAEALVGTELASIIHPEDLGCVVHEVRRFLAASPQDEPTTRIECRFRSGDGGWLDIESTINRHQGGLIFNSRDVSWRAPFHGRLQRTANLTYGVSKSGHFVETEDESSSTTDQEPKQADEPSQSDTDKTVPGTRKRVEGTAEPGGPVLQLIARLLALLLPEDERAGWIEEQRAILADLPGRFAQWKWVASWLTGMPRLAYTVRSSWEEEAP